MSLFISAFLVVMKRSDLMRPQAADSILFLSNKLQTQGVNLKANCLLQSTKCFSLYMCTDNKHTAMNLTLKSKESGLPVVRESDYYWLFGSW